MTWAEEQDWWGLEDLLVDRMIIESNIPTDSITQEILWETKDLDLIPISQMTTHHIQNCIRMILKSNKRWRGEYLQYLEHELNTRIKY